MVTNSDRSGAMPHAWLMLRADFRQSIRLSGCVTFRVSPKRNRTTSTLASDSSAANQKGVAASNHDTTAGSDSFPPMYGPRMKPRPNAAPISPKFFARCSGGVLSLIAACATEMLPPVAPSSARARNRIGRLRR